MRIIDVEPRPTFTQRTKQNEQHQTGSSAAQKPRTLWIHNFTATEAPFLMTYIPFLHAMGSIRRPRVREASLFNVRIDTLIAILARLMDALLNNL